MVGRLSTLDDGPIVCARPAGSWHHLSANGGPRRNDIDVILMLLADVATRVAVDERAHVHALRAELEATDDFADLPFGLMHPDPAGANLVARDDAEGVLVDWAGVGTGPRILGLATLIGSVESLTSVDAIVAGYREHASLEERELDRLEAALAQFPLILDCWTVIFQGESIGMLTQRLSVHRQRAAAFAARAKSAFAADLLLRPEPAHNEQTRLFD
jgi:Ser/Thr protein kinase RdoA (MazF antagonist)